MQWSYPAQFSSVYFLGFLLPTPSRLWAVITDRRAQSDTLLKFPIMHIKWGSRFFHYLSPQTIWITPIQWLSLALIPFPNRNGFTNFKIKNFHIKQLSLYIAKIGFENQFRLRNRFSNPIANSMKYIILSENRIHRYIYEQETTK